MDVDFEPGPDIPYKGPRPVLAPYLLRKAKLADLTKDENNARRSVSAALDNPAALASGNAKMLARKQEFDRLAAMRPKSRGRSLALGGMGS